MDQKFSKNQTQFVQSNTIIKPNNKICSNEPKSEEISLIEIEHLEEDDDKIENYNILNHSGIVLIQDYCLKTN